MRGRRRWFLKGGAVVLIAIAAITVLSLIVMTLWNVLVPSLFHGPMLGFWQAAGLLILSRILFGGFRGRGGPRGDWRWKERMWRERWEKMTPEERSQLREKFGRFGGRCGWSTQADEPSAAHEETHGVLK